MSAQAGPAATVTERGSRTAGATVWLTGLPSAGKTTIATAVAHRLRAEGLAVEILDGDVVRTVLSTELGFSRADRDANVNRIGWVAATLARHGVIVLASVISPYAEARAGVRARHTDEALPFFEVHVATPVEVCAQRDVKGLYAKQQGGNLTGLTGVDGDYEPPLNPELRLDTSGRSIDDVVDELVASLRKENVL
jgi:adenylylsulfate kinase